MRTVFIDIETDRLDQTKANPIQIACIAVHSKSLVVVDEIDIKIRFDVDAADPDALARNSYDAEVWEDEAYSTDRAMGILTLFFKDHSTWHRTSRKGNIYTTCEIAGHNAANYDAVVLANWYDRAQKYCPAATWTTGPIDTMHMARCLAWARGEDWGHYNLELLCERFGIVLENAHDALADARATVELARELRAMVKEVEDVRF